MKALVNKLVDYYITHILGCIITIWGMYDAMLNPRWEYIALVLIGATMVYGTKLGISLPGMGGSTDDATKG